MTYREESCVVFASVLFLRMLQGFLTQRIYVSKQTKASKNLLTFSRFLMEIIANKTNLNF